MGHPLSNDEPMELRRLRAADRDRWMPLWESYLAFYNHELAAVTTELTWSRLVGEDETLRGLCVVEGGALVGICHLVFHPSTWCPTTYSYLEDLFVVADRRCSGLGRALITAAVTEARTAGSTKLYWHTQENNAPARQLYEEVASNDGFIVYELDL